MKKSNLSFIGLVQALGAAFYCLLVAGLIWSFSSCLGPVPDFLVTALMLFLLVFSAAVTGSIVFGYSAYLFLNNKIKEALILLGYTLLYCLGIIIFIVLTFSVLWGL